MAITVSGLVDGGVFCHDMSDVVLVHASGEVTVKFSVTDAAGDDDAHQHGSKKISNTWLEIFDTLVQEDLSKIEAYKKVEAMDVIRIVNRRIKEQKHKK